MSEDYSLLHYNTFGIPASCKEFIEISSTKELQELIQERSENRFSDYFVLGGGSNLLLRNNIEKTVLFNHINGIDIEETNGDFTIVSCGGGENWHKFVLWTLDNGLGGIENLSLIPGSVGASPIQNIGAYGVELKDVFLKLEAISLEDGEIQYFDLEDCEFGYRDSVFKSLFKGLFFISRVWFKLTNSNHIIKMKYGAIKGEVSKMGINYPSPKDISKAVINIRQSKLPDPAKVGNSGSFFKNPIITAAKKRSLSLDFPNLRFFPVEDGNFKIAAGWLIDQAGWKGKTIGHVACYEKQALVIVNLGGASGQEIWEYALKVIESINEKYGIELQTEVNSV